MALLLSNVQAQPLQTIVTIPVDGAAASAFDFSGVKIEAGKPLILQSTDGAAQTIDLSSWEFDAAATTGNPATIQIQGFDCTLIVPASVPARVTAGEIVIEAISPFWTPQEITATKHYGLYAGDPSTYDASGDGSYLDWFGGEIVASKQDAGSATYNASSGLVEMRGGTSALLLDTGFGGSPYIFISVAQMIGQRGNQGIQGSTGSNTRYHRLDTNDAGFASATRSPDNGTAIWNGMLDGAGDQIESNIDNAYWPHPNASGASSNKMPLETPFFGISFNRNFGSSLRSLLFRYLDSNTAMSADIRAYFVFTSTPTTDEILRLQGWAAWDLINAFGGDIDADYLLSSNHPYYSGPPLLVGGGSSSVTVVTPTVTLTLSSLIAGSRVYVFNTTDSVELFNEVEATTTFTGVVPAGKSLLIRVRNASGSPKYKPYSTTATVPSSSFEIVVNQELDE